MERIQSARPYIYADDVRMDILRMIPQDGTVIGSIGCGRAATEATLIAQGREVHGVDISADAIAVAATRLTSARVIGLSDVMPFERNSLDGLILADVLEHMPLAWERLATYSAMLKPGGWMAISVPNMRHFEVLCGLAIRGDWPEHPLGIFDETHIQVTTHRRLLRWSRAAGLQLTNWSDCYDYRFVRRNIYRLANVLTFKAMRSFLTFEVQGVFRRVGTPA